MKSKLRAGTPIIALAFIGIAVLFIASCTTNEVEIPGLTGPSGSRLFITIEASPDHVFIKGPNKVPNISRITLQLKNQLGEGVANATIKVVLTNSEGAEVAIGNLDKLTVRTDSAGFARVTYTAPSTAEQPVPTQIFVRAILTDPAFAFEVVSTHRIDLELAKPFDCVAGPGAPTPSFEIIGVLAEDQQVCFDATGTTDNGTIISFTFDFGDGGNASGSFACHTFTTQGTFPVTLTVVDDDQNCVTILQSVTIGEGGSPTCTFTRSPSGTVNTDTSIIFDASASTDADGQIVSFNWTFGDGSSGSGETVTHDYDEVGTFTVTLTVRDNAGNEVVCTQTVTIGTGIPSCDFTITPDPATANEPVTFDASASVDPDGGNLEFRWDFDASDGIDFSPPDDTGEIVTNTYTAPGTFVVTLLVSDEEGNETQCTQSITVEDQPLPVCTFTNTPSPSCTGQNVTFDASASSPNDTVITGFEWDFDCPGGTANSVDSTAGPITINNFGTAGIFTVCLEITNNDGVTQTCNRPQVVNDTPVLAAAPGEFAPDSGEVGDSVQIFGSGFVNAANGGSVRFNTTNQPAFSVNGAGTVITTTVPTGATDGPITVSNNCGSDVSEDDFDVIETISINTTAVAQAEGTGAGTTPFTFTVTQSAISDQNTSVDFTTTPGGGGAPDSATEGTCGVPGDDYQDSSGTLNIPAGSLSATITVTVCRDADIEQNEGFTVTLSNPVNAVITNGSAAGVIQNDDL